MLSFQSLPLYHKKVQAGFTLLELMIVIAMIAVLSAIAIPSYRQYTVKNAESQAQARMKQLQIELETWRASSLSYKGFLPKKVANDGTVSYGYDGDNVTIQVPDAINPKYTITLLADRTGTNSLAATSTGFTTSGNAWRMIAKPNDSLHGYGAENILLTSYGLSCKSYDSSFTINATCNETGAKKW